MLKTRPRSIRGDSIIDRRSKSDFVSEIMVDQWAAAPLQWVANQWVAWEGRFHSNKFKPAFYPPAIMECRLCLWAQRKGEHKNENTRTCKPVRLLLYLQVLTFQSKIPRAFCYAKQAEIHGPRYALFRIPKKIIFKGKLETLLFSASFSQSKELTRGPPDLVQHFSL